jgi:PIN domain nuclease of toxin-antitoxin system
VKLLLDSHTLIWAADDPPKLTAPVQALLQDPSHDRLVSAASLWEIAIKFSLGRLPLSFYCSMAPKLPSSSSTFLSGKPVRTVH